VTVTLRKNVLDTALHGGHGLEQLYRSRELRQLRGRRPALGPLQRDGEHERPPGPSPMHARLSAPRAATLPHEECGRPSTTPAPDATPFAQALPPSRRSCRRNTQGVPPAAPAMASNARQLVGQGPRGRTPAGPFAHARADMPTPPSRHGGEEQDNTRLLRKRLHIRMTERREAES